MFPKHELLRPKNKTHVMRKCTLLLIAISAYCIAPAQSWSLTGNAGTNPSTNFVGTVDSKPLRFRVGNFAAGEIDSTTGFTGLGYGAGGYIGSSRFRSVSIGYLSCYQNPGNENTAVGAYTLYRTLGGYNTAIGYSSLYNNTNGSFNTAMGYGSCQSNTTGVDNNAYGSYALNYNSYGSYNTGMGDYALYGTTGSQYNTAIGYSAGRSYDLGYNNTILGANCGGSFSGQYNMIAIGQGVTCPDNSTARIGNSATWSIGGFAGWSNFSDGRFKKDIQENVKGLDFILRLRPITYHLDISRLSRQLKENGGEEWNSSMKTAIGEKEGVVFTGFVAQEVEQAAKDAQYDFSGVDKPRHDNGLYALRYAEFVVPLVKAMQEQQEMIKALQAKVATLEKQADVTVLLLQNSGGEKISAYPNPASGNMTVSLQTQQAGQGLLQLFDSGGKLVKQQSVDIRQGVNAVSLSIPELAAGYYTIKLDWGADMHKAVGFIKSN